MHDPIEQLKQVKHAVRFAPERRKHVRDYLVRMTAADVVLRAPRKEYRTFGSFFVRPMPVLAGIMGFVLLGGSTSLASQNALPGDVLYPVKVAVTEKIVEAVQFTPDAQAEYATELAVRRLDEATRLTERGEIAEDIEAELTERFDKHASRARTALEVVRAKNSERAERLAAAFEDAIRERQLALGDSDDDTVPVFAAALTAPVDMPAPDAADDAPTLMIAAVPSPSTSTIATSSEPVPPAPSSSVERSPMERTMKRGEDATERTKRVLKTKVRDTLREIREFRSQMETRRSELRSSGDSRDDDPLPRERGGANEVKGGDEDGREQEQEREREND